MTRRLGPSALVAVLLLGLLPSAVAAADPVAVPDSQTVAEDAAPTTVDVLANDTDTDGDTLTIVSATDPAHGTVVVADDTLTLTYQPAPNFNGTDTFDYTVTDGATTDSTTVTMTVNPVNDPPNAVADGATVAEDAAATTIDVLANDTDVDNDTLTITGETNGAKGTVAITGGGTGLTYDPTTNLNGADTFTYTIDDGNGGTDIGTVHVTITPANDPPTCQAESASGAEDTVIGGAVNCSDVDGNPLTYAVVSDGAHGTADFTSGPTYTYTPVANYHGPDSFTFRANDGTLNSATATATITVTSVNDAPNAVADGATLAEDSGATTINVLLNDSDADTGDILTITSATNGVHGLVAITSLGTRVTYTPNLDFNGSDTFAYTASDGHGGTDSGTVTVTVTPVNDNPIAVVDIAPAMLEDAAPMTINVLANDTDPDVGDVLSITAKTDGAHGAVTIIGGGADLSYQPVLDFNGSDTFTYTVSDGHGGTDIGTVTVTITPVNDNPTAADDVVTVPQNVAPAALPILVNDSDVDGDTPLIITNATNGSKGIVVVTNLNGPGSGLTYQPFHNASGADSFTYTISDGHGGTAMATVSVSISGINHPPNATNDGVVVPINIAEGAAATTLPVLANDTDPDGDSLFITAKTNGAHGSVTITGGGAGLKYKPAAHFHGTDQFTYTVGDGHGGSDGAIVLVTVLKDKTKPVATAPAEGYPGQTIGTTTSKARLAWSASDAGSGIARYTLQVSVNGGRFATVALGRALSRSVTRTLTDGKRYRFRVRATDGEGNVGNWAYGPTFKPALFQDTTSSVKYAGGWTKTTLRNASGGTTRHTSSATGRARFTATAYDLGWIVTKTTTSGSAQVWIDGALVTTINLHASTTKYRQLAYQIHFATHAIHTIEIRRMSGRVDLDAFAILR